MPPSATDALAVLGPWTATGLLEVTDDPVVLDNGGRWAVAISFEGEVTLARFARWEQRLPSPAERTSWVGPDPRSWVSSLTEEEYVQAVSAVRGHISRGEVYQANICRVLSTPVPTSADVVSLHRLLARGNPAPFAGALRLPDHDVHIACASPELYLRRQGSLIQSGPIKGTGQHPEDLQDKDRAENVMIVDLVRNDLGRICRTGSVSVPALLQVQAHPGLVHLVSTVGGQLRRGTTWIEILAATFPPGSVSGAPKLAALDIIHRLEPTIRGPYCGAFGWVDADRSAAELAVAIRTFWRRDGPYGPTLSFGTGAGITWGSDPQAEWRETQLKAGRLLQVASESEVP